MKTTNTQPSTYVINLARAPERLSSILAELRAAAVESPVTITAYDGHAADFPFHQYQHLAGAFWGDAARFKPGAFACYLSHAEAWRAILSKGEPYGIVLEDDIAIDARAFAELLLAELPDAFDVIFINWGMWRWDQWQSREARDAAVAPAREPFSPAASLLRQLVARRVFEDAIPGPGAYGYMVSPAGAAKLLAMMRSRKICMGVDYAMLFQSLGADDRAAIRAARGDQLPKSLRFFLPKEEAHLLTDGAITLSAYVYTRAAVVTIRQFPSTIQHGVYLDSSRFHR